MYKFNYNIKNIIKCINLINFIPTQIKINRIFKTLKQSPSSIIVVINGIDFNFVLFLIFRERHFYRNVCVKKEEKDEYFW